MVSRLGCNTGHFIPPPTTHRTGRNISVVNVANIVFFFLTKIGKWLAYHRVNFTVISLYLLRTSSTIQIRRSSVNSISHSPLLTIPSWPLKKGHWLANDFPACSSISSISGRVEAVVAAAMSAANFSAIAEKGEAAGIPGRTCLTGGSSGSLHPPQSALHEETGIFDFVSSHWY